MDERRPPSGVPRAPFGPTLVLVLGLAAPLLYACDDDAGLAPQFDPPAVTDAEVLEDGGPIFRTLTVDFDRPAGISIDYWTDGTPRLRLRQETSRERHDVFLPRLRADRVYRYEVRALAPGETRGPSRAGTFATDPLPERLQGIELTTVGVPSVPLTMLEALGPRGSGYFPFVVDEEGYIVWYRKADRGSLGFTRLGSGEFVFDAAGGLWVVNLRNEVVARLDKEEAAARTGIDPFTIHHDVIRTPENTVLMLVQDTVLANDTIWTGEAIWEWDPESDHLEKRWASKDFFDPRTDRGPLSVPGDWLHANSLDLGPRGNVIPSQSTIDSY